MEKKICTVFMDSLNTIHDEGITSKVALMSNQDMYEDFGIALNAFCNFALLSNTSKDKEGNIIPGNRYKVDTIVKTSIDSKEDIAQKCAMKIITILDSVLQQPTAKAMYNYCYTTINNFTSDIVDHLTRKSRPHFVSLDDDLSNSFDSDKDFSRLAIIPDNRYNPERILEERETLIELKKVLVEKRREKKEAILRETSLLSRRPAEAFIWLAVHYLKMKPRELALKIMTIGFYKVISEIVDDIAKENNINRKEIIHFVSNPKTHLTSKSVKIYTQDREIIAEEISRISYRAKNHIHHS